MEQEPVLCFFVTAAKDFFFMIYVVESYVSYHLLIVLSMENGRAVLIRHSQPCQPWKTSSYTIVNTQLLRKPFKQRASRFRNFLFLTKF
jgi:hypothetical protein